MINRKLFNQPSGGERHIQEHSGYDVVREWHDGEWKSVRWIYRLDNRWLIDCCPPYWLNRVSAENGTKWLARCKDHAIDCALGVGYRYLPHDIECSCGQCDKVIK